MASWHIPVLGSALMDIEEDFFGDLTFPPMRYLPLLYNHHPFLHSAESRLQDITARERERLSRQIGQELYGVSGDEQDKFGVKLDVTRYKPEEITVKVDGQKLFIKGTHRTETDTGYESCDFQRVYTIPEGIDTKNLTSNISEDGVLAIEAPKQITENESQEVQEKENYCLVLDVSGYKPEEISVRVHGRDLFIRGESKQEHQCDKGNKSTRHQHFNWHYNLPNDVNAEGLSSKYTKDGKLAIEAPRVEPSQPRTLEIMEE